MYITIHSCIIHRYVYSYGTEEYLGGERGTALVVYVFYSITKYTEQCLTKDRAPLIKARGLAQKAR